MRHRGVQMQAQDVDNLKRELQLPLGPSFSYTKQSQTTLGLTKVDIASRLPSNENSRNRICKLRFLRNSNIYFITL